MVVAPYSNLGWHNMMEKLSHVILDAIRAILRTLKSVWNVNQNIIWMEMSALIANNTA